MLHIGITEYAGINQAISKTLWKIKKIQRLRKDDTLKIISRSHK